MEDEIKKLRDAGFTDADINAYLEEQKSSRSTTAPAPAPVSPDQAAGQEIRADETVPDYGPTPETSYKETLGTLATAVAPYVLPAAIGGAGLYGASVLKSGFNAMSESAAARTAQANAQMATAEGLQARAAAREAARAAAQAQAAAPPRIIVPESAGGVPRPVAPAPAPAAPATAVAEARAPGLVQQGMDMARKIQQLAFEKVMQGGRAAGETMLNAGRAAAPYARAAAAPVAVGLTAALMPGNAGGTQMMIPQKGPYRGMEINPNTGRPWTAQELAVINR
jgi:hypothetical protein